MIVKHRAKRIDNGNEVVGFITKMFGQYHIIPTEDEKIAYPVTEESIEPCKREYNEAIDDVVKIVRNHHPDIIKMIEHLKQ